MRAFEKAEAECASLLEGKEGLERAEMEDLSSPGWRHRALSEQALHSSLNASLEGPHGQRGVACSWLPEVEREEAVRLEELETESETESLWLAEVKMEEVEPDARGGYP
jgi:hypothetical protein